MIRSTTNLVQVHVAVADSHGRPVRGLQRSDFQVLDDRKPEAVTLFEPDDVSQPLRAEVPDQQSNASTEVASAYSILVLDWLNLNHPDRIFAQDNVIKLLKTYQPRQSLALYLLDADPRLLHRFTTDTDELKQTLENTEIEFDTVDTTVAVRSTLEEQLLFWQRRVFHTLRAFDDIEHLFARLPGRKSLVWLSAGFPMVVNGRVGKGVQVPELTFVQDIEAALKKLNKADITLHVVDAVGLPVTTRSYSDVMFELALRSGGTVFMGRNDLDEGLREALDEMYSGYTVGFHVADDAVTGIHEITVRVNRKGLKLRYRESYEWATAAPGIKSK